MYFVALATDYDGTLAADGVVAPSTLRALERLRESGRKLILVTGRELPDLQAIFPELGRFDFVVAENGALLLRVRTARPHWLVIDEALDPAASRARIKDAIDRRYTGPA